MELEIAVKASEIMLNTGLNLVESIKKAIEIIGGGKDEANGIKKEYQDI